MNTSRPLRNKRTRQFPRRFMKITRFRNEVCTSLRIWAQRPKVTTSQWLKKFQETSVLQFQVTLARHGVWTWEPSSPSLNVKHPKPNTVIPWRGNPQAFGALFPPFPPDYPPNHPHPPNTHISGATSSNGRR
jgi:hypothetical protein